MFAIQRVRPMDINKIHKRYEEGRRFPRIKVTVPITLAYEEQQKLEAMIYDVSPEGIQIRCNHETAKLLQLKKEHIEGNKRREVVSVFNLPVMRQEKKLTTVCEICYMILLDENEKDEAALGLKFTKLKGRSSKYLTQFMFKK